MLGAAPREPDEEASPGEVRVPGLVQGDGALLCGQQWQEVTAGAMLTIPCGAIHRARGGRADLIILEVQHGEDLREDDIERLQDDYGRVIT